MYVLNTFGHEFADWPTPSYQHVPAETEVDPSGLGAEETSLV
jgi:hypothetical protein